MKKFNSLTELDLLKLAYATLLGRWVGQLEKKETANRKKPGAHTPIADHWISRYSTQLDELHAENLKLEQKGGDEAVE